MRLKKKLKNSEITFDEVTADNLSSGIGLKEKPIGGRVFLTSIIFLIIIVTVVFLRVFFLTVIKAEEYKKRADATVNEISIIPSERGIILDRFGSPLVSNESSLTVYLRVPEFVKQQEEGKVLPAIASIGLSRNDFMDILRKVDLEKADTIVLKQDISNQEAIYLNSLDLKSIFIGKDVKRVFSPEFAHIVGYTGLPKKEDIESGRCLSTDIIGKTNLELSFDSLLRGENGKIVVYRDAEGNILEEKRFSDPKAGSNLETTIDADLQKFFYNRLARSINEGGGGPGAVGIAMNPVNGEILSLVSVPGFASGEVGKNLLNPAKPLFNRAVSGLYSPGSIIKTIVATAALSESVIKTNEEILSTGHLDIPNRYNPDKPTRFVDWKAHGWVDVYSALARSSNIFFYAMGGGLADNMDLFRGNSPISKGLGVLRLVDYYKLFNLDKKTGIELSAEEEGDMPSPDKKKERTGISWTIGDTYNISIGQGDLTVTPIALLNAISSIVNGGSILKPHIAKGDKEVVSDISRLSPHMQTVVKGMSDAVTKPYGTANMLNSLPIKSIAKTGSAQVMNNTKTNAFIVGCAPVPWESKQPICILVLIENAREGSLRAVPVAYDVFEWYYENRLK
ncbi:MAG: penicillin-binding transpeptidase domain-containing protein [Candidatus Colwellbacteria bacterium]|nr:penicillin-binding transpeptidase domain-containing protein [Candidatus Colwellbacteria bacterium]